MGYIILTIALCVSLYVNWNLYRKLNLMEKYCGQFLTELTELKDKITIASKIMDDADTRGSFSSDDEVGSVFKLIKSCIDYMAGKKSDIENG